MSSPSKASTKVSAKRIAKRPELINESEHNKPEEPAKIKKPKPEKSKIRRIHVSGLPIITKQEVSDRFKSFGEVIGVDGLGKVDGNGKGSLGRSLIH